MEVQASFLKEPLPKVGITYLAAQVDRLSPDLGDLHPEYLTSMLEKAHAVMSESPEYGIKLYAALGVASL